MRMMINLIIRMRLTGRVRGSLDDNNVNDNEVSEVDIALMKILIMVALMRGGWCWWCG